jgi:hypothetical protein
MEAPSRSGGPRMSCRIRKEKMCRAEPHVRVQSCKSLPCAFTIAEDLESARQPIFKLMIQWENEA